MWRIICGRLLHNPLPLGQLPRPPPLEFDECIVAIDAHGDEAEKRRGAQRLGSVGVDGAVDGRGHVEE